MIDIITVVFRDELELLKIQARSLDLYADPKDVNTIYVIVNDNNDVVDLIDINWWTQHKNIQVVPYTKWNYTSRINGWENQQLCKLLAASEAASSWSMVLDAKTWLIQTLDLSKLFGSDNRPMVGTQIVKDVFRSSQQFVEQYYHVSMPDIIGPAGVPFLFHTHTVKDMIDKFDNFIDFFQTNVIYPNLITEFYLYSGFIRSRDGTYEKLYNKTQYYSCCNVADTDISNFNQLYSQMLRDTKLLTASIHRRSYPLLKIEQLAKWHQFLLSKGLNTPA
jgi:hypothetical protein